MFEIKLQSSCANDLTKRLSKNKLSGVLLLFSFIFSEEETFYKRENFKENWDDVYDDKECIGA